MRVLCADFCAVFASLTIIVGTLCPKQAGQFVMPLEMSVVGMDLGIVGIVGAIGPVLGIVGIVGTIGTFMMFQLFPKLVIL